MSEKPKPGIHENIDFAEYLDWDAANNSALGSLLRSAAHYKARQETDNHTSSEALGFGSFCHTGQLEPIHIAERYVVMPAFEDDLRDEYKVPKASNKYKEKVQQFTEVNAGKEIVSQEWFDKLLGINKSLLNNERAVEYFSGSGPTEVSIVWDDPTTGIRCKGRIDKLNDGKSLIVDLKTTEDASDFSKSIARWHYDRQAAFYSDGLAILTGKTYRFCIVAVEKELPFAVRAAPLSEACVANGRRQYRRCLDLLAECRTTESWPSYDDPDEWDLPAWAMDSIELNVNGTLIEF